MQVTEEKYMSLFDYLGRPAGPALGYAIATNAAKVKEPIRLRELPHLKKPINTYRTSYLITAFNDKNLKAIIDEDVKLYNKQKRSSK